MSKLNHSGIVAVHCLVPLGEDSAAIIMEYVDGGNLRDLLNKQGRAFPVADALRIACETASAIPAAALIAFGFAPPPVSSAARKSIIPGENLSADDRFLPSDHLRP